VTQVDLEKENAFLQIKIIKLEKALNALNIEFYDYKHRERIDEHITSREELQVQIRSLGIENTRLRIKNRDQERQIEALKMEMYQKRGTYV